MSLSACQTPQQQTGTLAGGALGAGAGALIGSAVTHGSAGGAIAGGLIGAAATPQAAGQCARWGVDYNNNRICIAYY